MTDWPEDIFTEHEDLDVDTLANLGPLAPMAGVWEGTKGFDVNPFFDTPRRQVYVERIDLQPVDRQSNGPQYFYGLRYHTHIVKPDEVETYHDQVGYWLWDPVARLVVHTLTIPRGQAVLATGTCAPDARTFTVSAVRGSTSNGIVSGPFLEHAFRTDAFKITVTIAEDGRSWSYAEETMLKVLGQEELFRHTDANTLTRVAPPRPNPLQEEALEAKPAAGG